MANFGLVDRGRRVAQGLLAPLGLLLLTACASTLDVRTLATDRADQSAYELSGRDLAALRREATLLCPHGGEILRQTAHEQRLEAVDSRMERFVHFSSQWISPPERHAQMVVVCKPVTDRQVLTAAVAAQTSITMSAVVPLPASASASGTPNASNPPIGAAITTSAASPASAPIGPLSVEW